MPHRNCASYCPVLNIIYILSELMRTSFNELAE